MVTWQQSEQKRAHGLGAGGALLQLVWLRAGQVDGITAQLIAPCTGLQPASARVGRVAGSPGSRGAKMWRPWRGRGSLQKGRGRSLKPKISITILIVGLEPKRLLHSILPTNSCQNPVKMFIYPHFDLFTYFAIKINF